MDFLKGLGRLFLGSPTASRDPGIYYYVRCDKCAEVIKVRINPMNDLSQSDDGQLRYVRKVIVGQRCYNRIEAEFTYNAGHKLLNSEITGGELVSEKEYQADQQSATAKASR
jgi:hypothetical protein